MIFSPVTIGNLTLKNRLVMPPMCMYSAEENGMVNKFHEIHYGTRAQGGIGLIIIEATAVEARGRISKNDLGIWDDTQIEGLKNLVDIIHQFGAKVCIQLGHAGRKAGVGQGVSSTAKPFNVDYPNPTKMQKSEIENVIRNFGKAAKRAEKCGFDMVEIHGAHGYLINQFISPLVNRRTDEYGCDDRYALLFLQDVIKEVKINFAGPICLRISAEEYEQNGMHPQDFISLVNSLGLSQNTKIDLLDVSSGGATPAIPNIPLIPGYQVPFADEIKHHISVLVLTGGLLSDINQIENILLNRQADLVWLGRELLRNPYWPLQAIESLKLTIEKPKQYRRAEPYRN